MGIFILGSLAGIPSVPFTVFEWLIRVLPGRLVIFGLELTVSVLEGLGFNIKNTAKTAEQVLAISSLFLAGLVIGLLFFIIVKKVVKNGDSERVRRYGLLVGAVLGLFSAVITLIQAPPESIAGKVGAVIWVLGFFLLWGWGMARLYLFMAVPSRAAPEVSAAEVGPGAPPEGRPLEQIGADGRALVPAEAQALSRRRFLIQVGGLFATIVVVGAGVGQVLRAQASPEPRETVKAPIPFPNADSPVEPVTGTRPEYTAVADHYQIDINLTPPSVDATSWRLAISGLVAQPVSLMLDQIKADYRPMNQFVTLSCISNPLGGPLIGTTLWTGASFREVLAQTSPMSEAKYAQVESEDGFHESIDLAMVNDDPRIMLTYAWNGEPLPARHGFPLRVYIPDRYGMKQPKWIKSIELAAEPVSGYWVARDWDEKAEMNTTSVIDTVATDDLIMRGGRTFVPIGGIAHAGAKGISKLEVQVDDGPWEAAELRAPLSGLTWVVWRYEWPFAEGQHQFGVRAYDGQGRMQETEESPVFPSGATGIYRKQAEIPPVLGQ